MTNPTVKNHGLRLNASDWIKKWSIILPKKVAIIFNDHPVTYAALNQRVNQLCNALLKSGVKKGDRVAVLLYNCLEFFEIFFACSRIEAVFVPLNFRLAGPEIEYILNNCTAETLFFGREFMERIEDIREKIPVNRKRFFCVGHHPDTWATDYDTFLASSPSFLVSKARSYFD